ncbi:MAG: hypothetical protein HRT89_20095 [Lentisphaeria bacterium]|nr:prolyl oligopeptidase family serine peptidase [Lentisphaeria bacterium]NQZ70361.1 hypothetical protein [Lentisphaeria bacterium]
MEGSEIQSIYLSDPGYCRGSIANLVPEIDQFKLATYLLPAIDPVVDRAQSKTIRQIFLKEYREMRGDESFLALGSVMNYSYRDMLTNSRPAKQFYIFIPEEARGKTVPLFVFLHGSGGNFKGYMWKWREFAKANNSVVVAPGFGFGEWDRSGSMELIKEVLDYCDKSSSFTVSKRYLVALSNGGIGAWRMPHDLASNFEGMALISPIMNSYWKSDTDMINTWKNRPILIIHGSDDNRIPLAYIKRRAEILSEGKVNLEFITLPKEDHFLFFSSWKKVSQVLQNWMTNSAD